MISTMPFDSNQPNELKSSLGSFKNLAKLSKSTKNNSDQNTRRSKLVQKSIFKLLSCSSYSPHQNPIKIELKTIRNCSQKLKLGSAEYIENARNKPLKEERERATHLRRVLRSARKRERRERWPEERERKRERDLCNLNMAVQEGGELDFN